MIMHMYRTQHVPEMTTLHVGIHVKQSVILGVIMFYFILKMKREQYLWGDLQTQKKEDTRTEIE